MAVGRLYCAARLPPSASLVLLTRLAASMSAVIDLGVEDPAARLVLEELQKPERARESDTIKTTRALYARFEELSRRAGPLPAARQSELWCLKHTPKG